MQINAYLTFNGNCKEAMIFYQQCLGGELRFQTIGESPLSGEMPKQMKSCIVHSILTKGDLVLMASDIIGKKGLVKGNAVCLSLHCNSVQQIKNCYGKLSTGGKANHQLNDSFYGALFGDLTDKYGNKWILNYNKNKKK